MSNFNRQQQIRGLKHTLPLLNRIVFSSLQENFVHLFNQTHLKQKDFKVEEIDFIKPAQTIKVSENTQQILLQKCLSQYSIINSPIQYFDYRRLKNLIRNDLKNKTNKSSKNEIVRLALKYSGTQLLQNLLINKEQQLKFLVLFKLVNHPRSRRAPTKKNVLKGLFYSKSQNKNNLQQNTLNYLTLQTILDYNSQESNLSQERKNYYESKKIEFISKIKTNKFKTEQDIGSFTDSGSKLNKIQSKSNIQSVKRIPNQNYLLFCIIILQLLIVIIWQQL